MAIPRAGQMISEPSIPVLALTPGARSSVYACAGAPLDRRRECHGLRGTRLHTAAGGEPGGRHHGRTAKEVGFGGIRA